MRRADFEAGPLGAVEVAPGEAIQIRSLQVLTGLGGFEGVIGTISCDEFGDCGVGGVEIAHHTDSSVTDVAELPVIYRFAP